LANNNPQMAGLVSLQQQKQALSEFSEFKFSGEGMSKKEAKKNCSHIALMGLYPNSYSAPVEAYTCPVVERSIVKSNLNSITSANQPKDQNPLKICQFKLLQQPTSLELKKRLDKILNNSEKMKNKTPAQLLHELSTKIAETGKCILENGQTPETKFCFQFKNIKDESCVQSDLTPDDIYSNIINDITDDLTKFAYGYGIDINKLYFKLL
jgi:hypothetical protein